MCVCVHLFFFCVKYVKEAKLKEMEQLNLRNQVDKGGIFFFSPPPSRINSICHIADPSLKDETVLPSCEIRVA